MMGLLVLIVFAVYLLVSVFVVSKAVGWAKASDRKPWLWGGLAAFVMYNLVFWDWIPTIITHKYYCSTQAGFWVYKTPEQWQKENPKMADKVTYQEQITSDHTVKEIANGLIQSGSVNNRSPIDQISKTIKPLPLLSLIHDEQMLVDMRTGFVLTKVLTFYSGSVGRAPNLLDYLRFWANLEQCDDTNGNVSKEKFWKLNTVFVNLGEKND